MAWRTTRRSQSVIPFGVGSIIEFENEALMPAGLDVWPEGLAEVIRDDRLAGRLGVRRFLVPPPRPERGVDGAPLPYVRFPQWHFCQRCRWLKRASLYSSKRPRCDNKKRRSGDKRETPVCGTMPEKKRPYMFPLRWVVACENGHVDDFPWCGWAHSGGGSTLSIAAGCKPENLFFYATQKGGLAGLWVECGSCNDRRNLSGVTTTEGLSGLGCSGRRPWFGDDGAEECDARGGKDGLKYLALQRGASNLYFAESASSILIPPYSAKIRRILTMKKWSSVLESVTGTERESRIKMVAEVHKIDPEQMLAEYKALAEESRTAGATAEDETEFRRAEYAALQRLRREDDDLLTCRPQNIEDYSTVVRGCFSEISLVERLTETRALTGFRRIAMGAGESAALSAGAIDWLPAFQVRGEGIFLRIRQDKLREFSTGSDKRLDPLVERISLSERCLLVPSRELLLLHTLSHLLIKRLSYEAGYGASSIRERLFSVPEGKDGPMAGILLYTAAGDSDGTLGGLVGLGRPGVLERVLLGAIEDARWCASDPICIESSGQGPESLNLGACHACSLLPETSCELQNRYLDRGAVHQFFAELLE